VRAHLLFAPGSGGFFEPGSKGAEFLTESADEFIIPRVIIITSIV